MQSSEGVKLTQEDKAVIERASARRWALGAILFAPILLALWLALLFWSLGCATVAWNGFRFVAGF